MTFFIQNVSNALQFLLIYLKETEEGVKKEKSKWAEEWTKERKSISITII